MPLWLTKRFWITENLLLGKLFSNYLYSKDHSPILVVFLFQLSFFVCVLFNDYYVESPCLVSLAGFHFLSSRQWFHSSINYHYFLLCVNLGAAPSSYFINFSNVQYFVYLLKWSFWIILQSDVQVHSVKIFFQAIVKLYLFNL